MKVIGTQLSWAWRTITQQDKKDREKHDLAMRGQATSGHLTPGERQRLFRNRRR